MPRILRQHAETQFAEELHELKVADTSGRPENWAMSPRAIATYIMGAKLPNGFVVTPKYYGDRRIIEIAIATLTTDRALLLVGIPGTGKTWVAEHLSAAISGDSKLLIQGTAGTPEEAIRYGWNYAQLLRDGPTREALVPSPMMVAMQKGKMARIEELTRIPSDVQDALITMLSEKLLPVPELNDEVQAVAGFNVIATANTRDRGVNELSSALKRRFNRVNLPLPATLKEEVHIVQRRVTAISQALKLPVQAPALEEITRIVTVFRELRNGVTEDGQTKVKSPSSTLSPAEAIAVVNNGLALAAHYGDGRMGAKDVAAGLFGTIVQDQLHDKKVWLEYLELVIKKRANWTEFYSACREIAS